MKLFPDVPALAGMGLTFFIAACKVLCFGFVAKIVLVTCQHLAVAE